MLAIKLGMIGSVEIGRVEEKATVLPAAAWFPKFDREALKAHEHWLSPHHFDTETGTVPLIQQSFILKTDRHTILIDTCIGNDKDRAGSPSMHMLDTPYLERLAALGLQPEDVDYVMCTHLHVDHIGWNTRLIDGRWVPTFPNARYVMSKTEFDATAAEAADPATEQFLRNCFHDSVLPIVDANRHLFIDDGHEMLDIIRFVSAAGHSPGNMRIELRSQGKQAVFAGDIVHSPMQIPFWDWSTITCWDQDKSAQARREMLEFCAETNALIIPGHFGAPHVGRIRDDHGRFAIDFGW